MLSEKISDSLLVVGITSRIHSHRYASFVNCLSSLDAAVKTVDAIYYPVNQPVILPNFFSPSAFFCRNSRHISGPELGCLISHRIAVSEFLRSSKEYALILEDDVFIDPSSFARVVSLLSTLKAQSSDFDMINLHVSYAEVSADKYLSVGDCKLYRPFLECTSAASYIITRAAAKNYLRTIAVNCADFPFDLFRFKFFCTATPFFKPIDPVSTIESQRRELWDYDRLGFIFKNDEIKFRKNIFDIFRARFFHLRRRIIRFLFLKKAIVVSHHNIKPYNV